MFSETVQAKIKKFDVYRKLPQDLTEPTLSGAIISIVALVCMSLLFLTELAEYLSVTTTSEMFVDINRGGEKLSINIDLVFPKFPCSLMSLDAQDVMGSHIVDIEGTLNKRRLDRDGRLLTEESMLGASKTQDAAAIKSQLTNGEGCQIVGNISVNKVPGNFHISNHAQHNLVHQITNNDLSKLDFSHQINHLSFGDNQDLELITNTFTEGVLSPLDSLSRVRPESNKRPLTYEYYIKVVPTTYITLKNQEFHVYQFTANTNEFESDGLPTVYFRYDLSPVTVKFAQVQDNFLHFLVQVCAIVGGVYTVAGLIESLIHSSVSGLLKKNQVDKLGK